MQTRNTGHRRYRSDREALKAKRLPCWLCNEAIDYEAVGNDPASFSADHIDAVSTGGAEIYGARLSPAHLHCNIVRGNAQGFPGMYEGRRPLPNARYVIPGSKYDLEPWEDRERPVRPHTIFPESRCNYCPCFNSQWWAGDGTYEATVGWAYVDVADARDRQKRL